MPEDRVDPAVVRAFWAAKSLEDRNRWTADVLLEHELALLRGLAPSPASILDLGSGHGELSRPLAGTTARLLAVDAAQAYGRSFRRETNQEFIASNLEELAVDERFDLVLLFGVVTSINQADELPLYRRMAGWTASDGVAVVKNQCAVGDAFAHTGFSEALGTEYSGRYPRAEDQAARLGEAFGAVEALPYPARLNSWATSFHVAFACREPFG